MTLTQDERVAWSNRVNAYEFHNPREYTHLQRALNKIRPDKVANVQPKSGVKYIYYNVPSGKWRVTVPISKSKSRQIGAFSSLKDAKKCRAEWLAGDMPTS